MNIAIVNSQMLPVKIYEWNIDFISKIIDLENYRQTFPFLASIDPYWNTYFNRKQSLEFLIPELKKTTDLESFDHDDLIKFISEIDYHCYLKVLWD